MNMDIGKSHVLLVFVLTIMVNNLQQYTAGGRQVRSLSQRLLHVDANDIVGAHGSRHVNRKVVRQSTVHQYPLAHSYRRKDTGNRHAGTHGLTQFAAVEHLLGVVHHIRCYTCKRNGKRIEVDRVMVGSRKGVYQRCDILARNKTTALAPSLLTPSLLPSYINLLRYHIGILLLTLLQALLLQFLTIREHKRPVQRPYHRVNLAGWVSAGIDATDETAHARTADDVDGYSRTFQHLQGTNVCRTLGTAATQHHGHLFPFGSSLLMIDPRPLTVSPRQESHQEYQYEYFSYHLAAKVRKKIENTKILLLFTHLFVSLHRNSKD